jgi:hypothetical protein
MDHEIDTQKPVNLINQQEPYEVGITDREMDIMTNNFSKLHVIDSHKFGSNKPPPMP